MRILVTGATGQVGLALASRLRSLAELCLPRRQDLDLSQPHSIAERLEALKPDLIINAGAYTAVDKAEAEPDLAFTVNAEAVEALGQWASQKTVPIIHFSTDYVFDGGATDPYEESHPVRPLSVYGASKAEGERLLLETGAACLIVRTAWVYSSNGKNFLKTMVKLAGERDELSIVDDQIGSPTSTAEIARFIRKLVSEGAASLPATFERASHLVHLTGSGCTSWHGFASAIVAGMKRHGCPVKVIEVKAISSSDYPTAAKRPQFSCLSLKRLERVFAFHPQAWERELDDVLKTSLFNHP